ncbi:MAG: bifunctional demethylmenaquinone methyltransferase/2-methoxy-6-polyprenyl-1,4-benzoquinol methylase UbiE [Saprospiraceae bacterium]
MTEPVKPYDQQGTTKKEEVRQMFDNIAPTYDFLNRFLSAGTDVRWRRKMLTSVRALKPDTLLDIATGTGDVAFEAARFLPSEHITGLDLSPKMLEIARKKAATKGLAVTFIEGDSEKLPFQPEQFGAVTVAFGVRNFEDLQAGIREIYRVLKPGGGLFILEFSRPRIFPIKQVFHIYFKYLLPLIGKLKSRDARAYRYLFESVQVFPEYEAMQGILEEAGFNQCTFRPLSFGICTIYQAYKPKR